MSARPAVGIRNSTCSLFPGPFMWHGSGDKNSILIDKEENMGSPNRGEIGNLYPRWKSSPHLGPLPRRCLYSAPGALFKDSGLLSQSFPTIHPVISWLDASNLEIAGTSWLFLGATATKVTGLWSTPVSEIRLYGFECCLYHSLPSFVYLCSISSPTVVYIL